VESAPARGWIPRLKWVPHSCVPLRGRGRWSPQRTVSRLAGRTPVVPSARLCGHDRPTPATTGRLWPEQAARSAGRLPAVRALEVPVVDRPAAPARLSHETGGDIAGAGHLAHGARVDPRPLPGSTSRPNRLGIPVASGSPRSVARFQEIERKKGCGRGNHHH
jgi:hypothetical protein